MDAGLVYQIVLIAISIIFSAFFSASETAFISLSELRVKMAQEEFGKKAASLDIWLTSSNKVLNTIIVGNNLANILAAVIAANIMATIFNDTAVAVTTGIMTFIVLIFGEVIPKTFARNNPVIIAIYSIKLLKVFYIIFYPITWVMSIITVVLLRFSGNSHNERPKITEDELEFLINVGEKEGVLEKDKGEMLTNIFDISDIQVKEVMVPRIDIIAVPENITKEDLIALVEETEFSRIPVYKESLDDIIGILYVKDLIKMKKEDCTICELMKVLREPLFVPETKKIDTMLKEFQKNRLHMAVVMDEYSGTAGIVTMEDILEEIVGDIFDEYDEEDKEVVKVSENIFLVDARMNIDDFCEEFELEKTEDMSDYETLGGFVFDIAGEIPNEGDSFEWRQYKFTVKEMKDRRLELIEIEKKADESSEEETVNVG